MRDVMLGASYRKLFSWGQDGPWVNSGVSRPE